MKFLSKLIATVLIASVCSTGCKKDDTNTGAAVTGIKLFSDKVSLVLGTSSTFTAKIEPATAGNKSVTWKSSDSTIVKVSSNGIVTAVKLGTATLTATTVDGNKAATCTITVTQEAVDVSDITLVSPPVSVAMGATLQLTALVGPAQATNKAVKWSSSNPAVFTVSETGLLSALTLGTAKVSVTTVDGNFTASADITITNGVIAVTGVTLDPTATVALNSTVQLTATIQPALAANRGLTWSTSDASIATVSQTGLVSAVAPGNVTITVKTTDGNKTATCQVTVEKQNLLLNPGFENGLTSWDKVYGSSTKIITDPAYVHSGTKSLVIGPDGGEGRGQILNSGFTAGVSYTVSAWCKIEGSGNPVAFTIQCYSTSGRLKDVNGPSITSTTWKNETFSTVIPDGTVSVYVFIWNNGGPALYTDDWTFTKD